MPKDDKKPKRVVKVAQETREPDKRPMEFRKRGINKLLQRLHQ